MFFRKMATRVSVVIPCYNQGRFLAQAIQSVLDQDYPDKEVIVVNDGSTDDTAAIASRFGDRIIYIEQPNRGAASARNMGIRASQGEYIAFLDADDVCLPGRLALEAAVLDRRPEVGLVAADAYLIDDSGRVLGLKSLISGAPRCPEDFRWETVEYCPTTSTVMVRRACFEVVGYFEESLVAGEDWLQWVRISHSFSMAYVDQPLILYRQHGSNITRSIETIHRQNRIASHLAITWERFPEYPPHFRARLLFYRFATAWRVEPKRIALRYFLRALLTDPGQLPYGLRVIGRGLRNTWRRQLRG